MGQLGPADQQDPEDQKLPGENDVVLVANICIIKTAKFFANSFINVLRNNFFFNIPLGLWNLDHRQCP